MALLDRSILSLVIRRIIIATVCFSVILTAIIYIQIDKTLIILRDRTIIDQAHDIASYIEKEDDNVFLDLPAAELQFYAQAGKFHQYVVREKNGNVLFTSPVAFTELYPETLPDNGEGVFFDFTGPQGTQFFGVSLRHKFDDKVYLVQVIQSEQSADAFPDLLTMDFLHRMGFAGMPFVALLIGVIYWSVRQSLYPLHLASQEAKQISFKRMDVRISEQNMPSEILPLIKAVNNALSKLEQSIEVQREFVANAAHELRTPISILRSHVDSLEDEKIAERLRQDVDAMARLVAQLLDMSRLDFPEALPMEQLDLTDIVSSVCRDIWPLFIKEQRELQTDLPDKKTKITGNHDTLYRAIRNLLENALTHSPAKTPVEITLSDLSVMVRDHGSPIPETEQEHIFERFRRGHRSGPSSGAGLGLAIVTRTMELHGGKVRLKTAKDGNMFTLEFPDISTQEEVKKKTKSQLIHTANSF